MPHFIKRLAYIFPLIVIVLAVCYFWVDRPVALWAFHTFGASRHPLGNNHLTTLLTEIVYAALIPVMLIYVYLRLKERIGKVRDCLELLSITVPVAFFIKTPFQYILGRYGPRYNEVLLFNKKVALYGFHFFSGGSFPSGHMCVFTAAAVALSVYYHKLIWPSVAALLVLAFLLIAFNYHFVSDVIGGTYFGLVIGIIISYLQQQCKVVNH